MSTVYTAPLQNNGTFNPNAGYAEMVAGEAFDTGWATLQDAEGEEQWEEATPEELAGIRIVSGGGTVYSNGNGNGNGGFFLAWEN